MTALLHAEEHGPVRHLVMTDESSRNSLSEDMMRALATELSAAQDNQDIAVVVVRATGRAYCSGHNLKQLSAARNDVDGGFAYFTKIFEQCAALMLQIAQHRCPVIAEVQGLASAAGCQLVATCDLAYASSDAGFCTPGVNIGLFCSTPMVALSRAVGLKHAMEMLLTGDVINAAAAERIGLVNAVFDCTQLRATTDATANKIAAKSQAAIAYGKRCFRDQLVLPLPDAYAQMSAVMARNMMDGAACEGIDAFLAKRTPRWPN